MNNDAPKLEHEYIPETTPEIHIYKSKPWVLVLNIFYLIIFGGLSAFFLGMITSMVTISNNSEGNYRGVPLIFLCFFTPFIVMQIIMLAQIFLSIISIFFSYIKITPEWIENKIWPYRHIRSRWSEVDRRGMVLFYEAIFLHSFEVVGTSLSYSWPFKHLNILPTSIVLSTYNGWPMGQLASDLKRYAPHLFVNQLVASQAQTPEQGSKVSDISQEQRLLAALSHGSVLFTGIGLLIPILIYATQKKKSAFLAFHALQAFIYQLIGNIINFLFPFCLLGAIFLIASRAPVSGTEDVAAPFLSVTLMITLGITLLLVFGSIGYSIYGVIGAVMTYQGKDFRYAFIGKRIDKRNHPGSAERPLSS